MGLKSTTYNILLAYIMMDLAKAVKRRIDDTQFKPFLLDWLFERNKNREKKAG